MTLSTTFALEIQHSLGPFVVLVEGALMAGALFMGCSILIAFLRWRRGPKRSASQPEQQFTCALRCPACARNHCENPGSYRDNARDPMVSAKRLVHLEVIRCRRCGGVFDAEGQKAPALFAKAVAAMDATIHVGRDSTASERAYHLRKEFERHGLDESLFSATRRQLACQLGLVEPARFSVDRTSKWSASVPRRGLIGASMVHIDGATIRFGRIAVPIEDTLYLALRHEPARGLWALSCMTDAGPQRLAWIEERHYPELRTLVEEMEGRLDGLL